MRYDETLGYLAQLRRLGVRPGTAQLAEVLSRLGHPERAFSTVSVVGTNGKGSTAAFCAHLLVAAAKTLSPHHGPAPTIGLYTSPHLARVRERIRLSDGSSDTLHESSEEAFAAAIGAVRTACERPAPIELTFFETLTAAACWCFAHAGVTIAVVEAGIGARLDATQVCRPVVSVLTSIALDHQDLIGPGLLDIAREKAGVFRPGVPSVLACDDPAIRAFLVDEATRVGAQVSVVTDPIGLSPPLQPDEVLPLLGRHQQRNARLALAAVTRLPAAWPLTRALHDPATQRQGLLATRWPGRLERLLPPPQSEIWADLASPALRAALPAIWIDAAHNPDGTQALAAALPALVGKARLVCVVSMSQDKDLPGMLAPLAHAAAVVVTQAPSPRACPAAVLGDLIAAHHPALPIEQSTNHRQAFVRALRLAGESGCVVAYGSIFLIGPLRAYCLGESIDPVTVQDPLPVR